MNDKVVLALFLALLLLLELWLWTNNALPQGRALEMSTIRYSEGGADQSFQEAVAASSKALKSRGCEEVGIFAQSVANDPNTILVEVWCRKWKEASSAKK